MAKWFIFSVAVILFVTGIAKVYSATGSAEALGNMDPFLPASNRTIFYAAGVVELLISAFLLAKSDFQTVKLSIVAWLTLNYLAYRAGLLWVGAPPFCDCLGNLNDRLFVSPRAISWAVLVLLAWMTVGSGYLLCCEWFGRSKLRGSKPLKGYEKLAANVGDTYGNQV